VPQGISAEVIAERWDLSREELDRYSLQSHERAARAIDEGRFERELVPIDLTNPHVGVVFDTDEAVRRLRERGPMELGEALLDQRALTGIGNVYKNEVCFIERVSPWRAVGELDDETLQRLVVTARDLLRKNAGGGRRVTTGAPMRGRELWIYGRAGRPCRRCGTLVQSRRQGQLPRTTYWCPTCQG
jgi:endonuclease-8